MTTGFKELKGLYNAIYHRFKSLKLVFALIRVLKKMIQICYLRLYLGIETVSCCRLQRMVRITLGTRGFFSRATGSFVSSAASRHVFGQRPKTRAKRESLFKTWPKPETAHEKPLAPTVGKDGHGLKLEKVGPNVCSSNDMPAEITEIIQVRAPW